MILRLPENIAAQVSQLMTGNLMEVTDMIEMDPFIDRTEQRVRNMFKFKFGEFESNASIMELPCVIESHKTIDDVNFYKCSNIS